MKVLQTTGTAWKILFIFTPNNGQGIVVYSELLKLNMKIKSVSDFMSHLDSVSFKLVSDVQKSGIFAFLQRLK
jgi:hypothetical protein